MKTRLLGAAVLIALLVIFVPMFFSSNPSPATSGGDQSVSLAIPPAQDNNLQTRTMSLTPGAPATAASAASPASAATAAASGQAAPANGQLASVNIPANRAAGTAGSAASPANTLAMGSGASPTQPVIPLRSSAASAPAPAPVVARAPAKAVAMPAPVQAPASAPAAPPVAAAAAAPAAGDHVLYVLNLSAYANTASVDRLVRRVRGFGYPVLTRIITQAGKQLTLVTAGPFDSRTSAEAARLKITQSIPGVPAKLEAGLGHADANITATPVARATTRPPVAVTAAPRAGGYAVQVAAMGSQAEANALRDKLRANGFDGFVDTVAVNGKRLWRVRAGPQTQRADAERVRDQIKARLGLAGNVVSVP